MEYFTIEEKEHIYDDMVDQDGNPVEPYTGTSLYLYPKGFTIDLGIDYTFSIASIGFIPKGVFVGGDPYGGGTLLETEEGAYVCGIFPMLQIELHPEGDKPLTREYLIVESVQNGIMDGRWEITVLEK